MASLERVVFGDETSATYYEDAAGQVWNGISQWLFNSSTDLYRVPKLGNDTFSKADFNVWYPDSVAHVWPHLFGVTEPDYARAQAQMATLNENWDGSPNPDWTTNMVDPTGFLRPSLGHAALNITLKVDPHTFITGLTRTVVLQFDLILDAWLTS